MEGGGHLVMEKGVAEAPVAALKQGLIARFLNFLGRFFFKRMHGSGPERTLKGKPGGPISKLTFTLRMDAGGPTGPLVNAMLGPALLPAAEDLANKIAAHLEKTHLS
jgi:hypothetical protein